MPFLGKSLLNLQIEFLQSLGFKQIIAVLNRDSDQIGNKNIQTVIQSGQGQAAAILSAKKYIGDEPVLILNADDIVSPSLFESLFYILNRNVNILVGFKTTNYFPGGYLKLNGKKVLKIIEKPGIGEEPGNFVRLVCDYYKNGKKLINTLETILPQNNDMQYEDGINALIFQGEEFEILEYEDTWIPLKYPWQTLDVTGYFLQRIQKSAKPKSVNIHKSAHLSGPIVFGENVKVMENAKISGPTYIGNNTIIGNNTLIRESMVGNDCVIGFSSDIARSYIGDHVWLHSNYIGDSVICDHVTLGAGTVAANLRLDEKSIFSDIKNNQVDSYRKKFGTIVGGNTRIGIDVKIMPGVKIGKNSIIGPGILLDKDLADNKKCFLKQQVIIEDNRQIPTGSRSEFRKKI